MADSNDAGEPHRLCETIGCGSPVGASIVLQVAVIYVPFLQHAFSRIALSSRD